MFHLFDFGRGGTNLRFVGLDLLLGQLMFGSGLGKPGLIGARVNHIKQIALFDPLVIRNIQLYNPSAHMLRHDVHNIGANHGIIGSRVLNIVIPDEDARRCRTNQD